MSEAVAALREQYPLLSERVYCASQCLGPCPRGAFEDFEAYRRTLSLRSRGLDEWIERYEQFHGLLERLLGAPKDSVFLTATATAAHAAIASNIEPRGDARRIVTSSADFHSTRFLWQAQERRGFEVVEVAANGPEHAFAETFLEAIDERTAVVALSLVSPRTGALLPARELADHCRKVGAALVLDAYQAVGVVPVDVTRLGAHAIIGGTHKWLGGGGAGLAFGYVEPSFAESRQPQYPGWIGHASLRSFADRFVAHPGARRFEQGTPALEPIYTARAGIEIALAVGVEALRERSLQLTGRLLDRLHDLDVAVRTPREEERRGGMVCLAMPDADAVVASLERQGIDVDARPGAGLRIGPHPCQTEDEVDAVVDAIAETVREERT